MGTTTVTQSLHVMELHKCQTMIMQDVVSRTCILGLPSQKSLTKFEFFGKHKVAFCITSNINKLEIVARHVLDITYHSEVYRICQSRSIQLDFTTCDSFLT